MEEETRVMLPQDQEGQESPEAGRGKELFPRAFGEGVAWRTPGFRTSGLQNCDRIHSLVSNQLACGGLCRSPNAREHC